MKKEECGLFGIYGHPEAARMTYFGLYALQHRGQESAGIVTWDGQGIREQRGMGLVHDVFQEHHLSRQLKGDVAVGHVRYATTGASLLRNAQPFRVMYKGMHMALAHNGNLVNTAELREELENQGTIFQTSMDSEVIMHLVAKHMNGGTPEEAVTKACSRIKGAFALLFLINRKLIAVRDPWGIRPLALGRVGDAYVLASETCAFDLIEAEHLRDLEPGEMLVIEDGRMTTLPCIEPAARQSACIFELIYFARPDSLVFGHDTYSTRKTMGQILARESPVEADFVMPFPDSGVYAAVGYSQQSGLPFEACMIRNHYVGRTFIQPTQDMRDFSVRMKLNPVRSGALRQDGGRDCGQPRHKGHGRRGGGLRQPRRGLHRHAGGAREAGDQDGRALRRVHGPRRRVPAAGVHEPRHRRPGHHRKRLPDVQFSK